jgi:PKD repeat protein
MLKKVFLFTILAVSLVALGCSHKPGDTIVGPGGGGTQPPLLAPTARFTPDKVEGDAPVTVSFTDQSSGDISSWAWDFGDGTASTSRNTSHQFGSMGKYTVRLTVTGPGGSAAMQRTVTVDKVVVVTNADQKLGPFWPAHTNGDCDFHGNGPIVDADARLGVSSDGRRLLVYAHMKAAETASDWTTAESAFGPVPIVILPLTSTVRIKGVLGSTESSVRFQGSGFGYTNIAGSSNLASFSVKADTDGNDVCNQTLDDTHMYVWTINYTYRIGPQ